MKRTNEVAAAAAGKPIGKYSKAELVAYVEQVLANERLKAQHQHDGLETWSKAGVWFMLVLSAGLNGFSNQQHSPSVWAAWAVGISIPVIVLILFRVASLLHRRDCDGLSRFVGGAACGLLILSVFHCADSLSILTGSSVWLALPLAIAIDCGLVGCELAELASKE